jgi:hypothetical protein
MDRLPLALALALASSFVLPLRADELVYRPIVEPEQEIPYKGGVGKVEDLGGYALAPNGAVYFSATLQGGGAGVWRIDADDIAEILGEGTPIADNPNETWTGYFPSLAANASGTLALYGLNDSGKSVVGVFDKGAGRRLAGDGDLAPTPEGGRHFTAFGQVWINDEGTVAVSGNASATPVPALGSHPGVWLDRGTGLELLVLGALDGDTIPFDLADGDLAAFVKIEEGGASGIFTRQGDGDKALRLPLGTKIDHGDETDFLAEILGLAANAAGRLAAFTVLVDADEEIAAYPTLVGRAEGEANLKGLSTLFSDPEFMGFPIAVNSGGSVLVATSGLEEDGGALLLHRADGSVVTIARSDAPVPGIAGGMDLPGFRTVRQMLDDEDGVVFSFVTEEGEILVRATFGSESATGPAPRRRPSVTVNGRPRRAVRAARITLRGTVSADSRPRVEVRAAPRRPRSAVLNAPGNRWVAARLALRKGRNNFVVQAVAGGLRSAPARVVVTRRR